VGALVLDLLGRECSVYAHLHDFGLEATAILADRVAALVT
jgi:hypothetical protein